MPTDTKTALLDSAERAARTRGFDGFSFADLAEDVGIRKASIHHHFPTKAALSVALMQRYYTDLEKACADIDAAETTGGAHLSALINRYRNRPTFRLRLAGVAHWPADPVSIRGRGVNSPSLGKPGLAHRLQQVLAISLVAEGLPKADMGEVHIRVHLKQFSRFRLGPGRVTQPGIAGGE